MSRNEKTVTDLLSEDSDKQETALFVLLHTPHKEDYIEEIITCSKSGDDDVRLAAFMVLSAIKNEKIIPCSEAALEDKYWKIRAVAAISLSKYKNEKAIPVLKSLIFSKLGDHSIHKRAIEALGKYKNEELLDIFVPMLRHSRILDRIKAVQAIQKIVSEKSLKILIDAKARETDARIGMKIRDAIADIERKMKS